jgi:nitronate monooxygenase
MTLRTAFTRLLSVEHPMALAPMSGCAGGALAAAVCNAGGLGLIGGGGEKLDWCQRQVQLTLRQTDRPWGIGFLAWALERATLEQVLSAGPAAVMLSFGDPRPFAEEVRQAGARLIVQVTDLDEARQAIDVGADVVVAQGSEAGGHGGRRATMPFVPAVVDLAAPTPVLAAGGIADGRGLAAALVLGAAGALIGTRFQVTHEALAEPAAIEAILKRSGDDTERSRVLDIARGSPWPQKYTGRTLRTAFLEQWRGREEELARDESAIRAYKDAASGGDVSVVPVWAGEAIDLITDLASAADLVTQIAREAEEALGRAGKG